MRKWKNLAKNKEFGSLSKEQERYLPSDEIIEQNSSKNFSLQLVFIISAMLLIFIVWASLDEIDEVTVANGQVVPVDKITTIQHLEGGTIQDIVVENGQFVKRGDKLIKLNQITSREELEEMRVRKIALQQDLKRLNAFINYAQQENASEKIDSTSMYADEKRLLKAQKITRAHQVSILESVIEQREKEIEQYIIQKNALTDNIKLLKQEADMYSKLQNAKAVSRLELLRIKREINKSEGEFKRLDSKIIETNHALQESKVKLAELQSTMNQTALEKIGEINAELMQLDRTIARLEDKLNRLTITSPIDGIVKGLSLTVGSVIPPSGFVMEVVLFNHQLRVESQIESSDIGHVRVGDPAKVKVLAYNFSRYGTIKGKVVNISASTYAREDGTSYYQALIDLNKMYVGSNEQANKLLPGMTVEANIITGKKSLMDYLLKPIRVSADAAFSEP